VAANGQGLGVGKLYVDILLLDAWKFAVELVAIGQLLDVELGGEGLQALSAVAVGADVAAAAVILVEVIEETEKRVEGGGGIGADE